MRRHFKPLAALVLSFAMVWLFVDPTSLYAQKGGGGKSRGGGGMSRGGGGMSRSGGGGMSRSGGGMSRSGGGMSRSGGGMSRSYGGSNSFSRSFSSPSSYSRSNNSRSFSAPANVSRGYKAPSNYSRSISPGSVSRSYGTPGYNSRSFATPSNFSHGKNSPRNVSRGYATPGISPNFKSPTNISHGFNSSKSVSNRIVPAGISHSSRTSNKTSRSSMPGNFSRASGASAGNANASSANRAKHDNQPGGNKYTYDGTTHKKMPYDDHHDNGHPYNDDHHHYGHGHHYSQFFFSPYGFGYNFYGNGFGLSIGLPFYGYGRNYNSGPGYCAGYASQPYYDYYGASAEPGSIEPGLVEPALVDLPTESQQVVESSYVEPVPAPVEQSNSGSVIAAAGHAAEFQKLAEVAFREHRYEDAARLVNHALIEDGKNGKLHLFASQTFFALGEYRAAAAAIQRAAAQLEQDDWGFVVENFKTFYRGKDYVTQMDDLVKFAKENPDQSYASFLRGYHYKYLGYDKAARKQLAQAVKLESRDRLAAKLLVMTGGTLPENPTADKPIVIPEKAADEQETAERDTPDSRIE